jgi:hypothetical protein
VPLSISAASDLPRRPNLVPRDTVQPFTLPRLGSPFKPLITPSPAINGLKAITPAITTWPPPPWCSLTPYKRRAPPLEHVANSALTPELFLALLRSSVKLKSPPIFIIAAPPHRSRSCSGEPYISFTSLPSPSPALIGELWRTIAPGAPCAGDALPRGSLNRRSVHHGPEHTTRSTRRGPSSWDFSLENNLGKTVIQFGFAKKPL